MAPETQENGSTEDISEEQQEQQQAPAGDTSGQEEQQQNPAPVTKDTKLPDDHPVLKQWKSDKDKLTAARAEVSELRAQATKVTQLEQELADRPTKEAIETLQTRYDRLEAFLTAAGGPLGKALDSRTFTRDLFETDKDIESLVKDWHKNNPTATSAALGASAAGGTGTQKVDQNALLRAAVKASS